MLQSFVRDGVAILNLRFGDEVIGTTDEHPFYVEGKGFVKAGALGLGTSIVTRAGPSLTLSAAETKHTARVYNFTVADFHTYFVGQNALWVHNALVCVEGTFFRGGNSFNVRPNDIRIVDGLVQPTRGVSLFNQITDSMEGFGGAHIVQKIPEELQIIQRGINPNHFEITPKEPMTLERFQELLNQIQVQRVGG